MPRRIRSTLSEVADKLSKIRDFLWQEARRRPHKYCKGPQKLPNGLALARAMGVSQPTISRILRLTRNTIEDSPAGVDEFSQSARLERGLMALSGIESVGELWDAIYAAPEAPPVPKPRRTR